MFYVSCVQGERHNRFLLHSVFLSVKKKNITDDSHTYIDHESVAFTKLLSSIAEKLGSNTFPELQHILLNLKCPDGSQLLNPKYLYCHNTVIELLMSLVTAEFCTIRDLDVLIHILCGLKRQDLLTLISAYIPNITVGNPLITVEKRVDSFIVMVSMHDALKLVDLGVVSAIKLDICTCCIIQDQPFLMQYIGWKTSPVTLYFRVPSACMTLFERGLKSSFLSQLSGNGIDHIKLCFNCATVYFSV